MDPEYCVMMTLGAMRPDFWNCELPDISAVDLNE